MEQTSRKWLAVALVALLPLVVAIFWVYRSSGVAARQTPGPHLEPGSGRWVATPADKRPARVTPTTEWVNFISQKTTLDGQPVPVGSIVRAFDSDGVVCGEYTVDHAGWYGLLSCYGDDPNTPGDEGARPNDPIHFTINDLPAVTLGPDEAKWVQNGVLLRVDLAATSTGLQPTATATPEATATSIPAVPSATSSAQQASPTVATTATTTAAATSSPPAQASISRDFLPLLFHSLVSTFQRPQATLTPLPKLAVRASRWCGGQLPRVVPCVR
ncbi:MAG: hypothetical protein GXP41_03550 [Chloroflexi bacterium]|nr:hypothetical protein [Chloroflexota bacterium]